MTKRAAPAATKGAGFDAELWRDDSPLLAAHGYGPMFLAGAEMIELRRGKGANANMNGGLQFGKPRPSE